MKVLVGCLNCPCEHHHLKNHAHILAETLEHWIVGVSSIKLSHPLHNVYMDSTASTISLCFSGIFFFSPLEHANLSTVLLPVPNPPYSDQLPWSERLLGKE